MKAAQEEAALPLPVPEDSVASCRSAPTSQLVSEDAGRGTASRHQVQRAARSCLRKPPQSQELPLLFIFPPLLWKAVCSACGGPTPSRCSRPAVAAGLGLFFFARRFCFHDHTNCNKLYKKTLASP